MSSSQVSPKRSRFRLLALIAVPLAVIAGGLTYAHQGMKHGGHGHGQHLEHHLDHLASLLAKIGASDAQKSQIDGLLRGAFTELRSAHESHTRALGQFHEVLLAPSIDRVKMETLRSEQLQTLDAASKRLMTAFGDAAEILSAEQRAALAEEVRRHHAH